MHERLRLRASARKPSPLVDELDIARCIVEAQVTEPPVSRCAAWFERRRGNRGACGLHGVARGVIEAEAFHRPIPGRAECAFRALRLGCGRESADDEAETRKCQSHREPVHKSSPREKASGPALEDGAGAGVGIPRNWQSDARGCSEETYCSLTKTPENARLLMDTVYLNHGYSRCSVHEAIGARAQDRPGAQRTAARGGRLRRAACVGAPLPFA